MGACSHDDEHDAYKHLVEDEMIAGRTPPRFHEPEQESAKDEGQHLGVEGLILLAIVFVLLAVYVSAAGALRRFLR